MVKNIQKEDVVLSLITKATNFEESDAKGIRGKKALQKSLYLFNLKFRMFGYKWGDYGPLCREIQHIVEDLVDQGDVTITDIPTKMKGATIKQLQSDHELSEIPTSDPIDKELDDIVSFIAGRSPRDLELLASVHFWVDRQRGLEGKHLVDYILEKLTCLKPDARFSRSDVEHAIDVLESSGYLSR